MAGPSGRVEAAVAELIEPALADAGYLVEEVRLTPAGSRRVLRILLDRADDAGTAGPLDLDDIADASRVVGATLDGVSGAADPLGSTPYTLEVSSPGVDRPLTLPRHFRRNVGRLVLLRRVSGPEVTGRVVSADDGRLHLDVAGTEQILDWPDVERAQVQIEFTRRAVDDPDDVDDGDDEDDEDDEEG